MIMNVRESSFSKFAAIVVDVGHIIAQNDIKISFKKTLKSINFKNKGERDWDFLTIFRYGNRNGNGKEKK